MVTSENLAHDAPVGYAPPLTRDRTANINGAPRRPVPDTMAPFSEDAPLLGASAQGAERSFIGIPGAPDQKNRITSVVRAVLVAAIACTCVAAGANHVAHRISFEPHANGIKSFLGWAPDGLDVPLDPPQVTLLAACHLVPERVPAFRNAINSWVKAGHDEAGTKRSFDKVILVDWSSEADLWGETARVWGGAGIPTPLSFYKVYGNDGEPLKWQLAKAVNFGLSKVTTEVVLKVDCDTYVERGLLELNPLQNHANDRKIFRYGDYRSAKDENEIHINGCIMARMDTLREVNMYDERLQQYGWDDSNLYDRLRDSGAQDLNITRRNAAGHTYITHVWHPHSEMSQDARVGASCVNRCAVNRLERYNPWKNQQRAEYREIAEAPPNIPGSISFHSYRGGNLPSVLDTLGKETSDLLATYCKNSQFAAAKCYAWSDWSDGWDFREELDTDKDVRWATEKLKAM